MPNESESYEDDSLEDTTLEDESVEDVSEEDDDDLSLERAAPGVCFQECESCSG